MSDAMFTNDEARNDSILCVTRIADRRVVQVVAVSMTFCVATTYPVAQSQTRPTDNPPTSFVQKVVSAERVEEVQLPVLDGDVLNDAAWSDAVPVSGFLQSTPNEGEPATERTEVRVIFTEDTVYFGVVCYDRDPSLIIMSDSRRDSSMNDADSFQMVLDTFNDQQNGFVFGTTPAGQEYDGQVVNEGEGRGGFRTGGQG